MCNIINRKQAKPASEKKHATPFRACSRGKMYSVPLKCGVEYIGQTGRCINDRLPEHENEATSSTDNPIHPIAVHANECIGCAPDFARTDIKGGHRNRYGREIIESFLIQKAKNNVSSASVTLSRREIEFIRPELERYCNSP